MHGFLSAYTMFIDLSGFTPLTETLMKQGTVGAEQLSYSLNNIFAPMVAKAYKNNGFIPYFAGDAFTAIFPEATSNLDAESFLSTAFKIKKLFDNEGLKKTSFGDFHIGIKIGLSFGQVEWGLVGDDIKSFYFKGPGIETCVESEKHAKEQDVIIDQKLLDKFTSDLPQLEYIADKYYRVTQQNDFTKREPPKTISYPKLRNDILERFLPQSVINLNEEGEFRNVVSVFLSFTGVKDHEQVNQFATVVLNEFSRFSGYFKEVDFGDKGGVMVGFFGAPVSFENNIERALEFVIAIEDECAALLENTGLKYRIGITSGLAFTGTIGGKERSQYAAVGNHVNLAARLMIYADWGEVLVDEDIQRSQTFTFTHKGDIQYKGIEGDIPTYKFVGKSNNDRIEFTGKLIGREEELMLVENFAKPIYRNEFAGIAYLYGEAGIGKSRLSYEIRKRSKSDGVINWFTCQADEILKKPFNPFVYFLRSYFNQSPEKTNKENLDAFSQKFRWLLDDCEVVDNPMIDQILPELVRTETILAALIGIQIEGSLWSVLDAKGRYQNTFNALIALFRAEALIRPTILELEDGHWYDSSSRDFLAEFVKEISGYGVFILVTSRYDDNGEKIHLVQESVLEKQNIPVTIIDLNFLKKDKLKNFAEHRLEGPIDEELLELLIRMTNGNPFYLEQILEYFTESKLLEMQNDAWHIKDKSIKVSSSINSVLMARIDRLSTLVKETVKTAAVIGSEFELPVLNEVLKDHEEFVKRNGNRQVVLSEQIRTAEQGQIWRAVSELRYMFKHSLMREAVYDMQLKTRIQHLHGLIAGAIEKLYTDKDEERYVDLAFHYEQAGVPDKTNLYLEKAADHARRNYQNQQALNLYKRLLKNLKEEDQKGEKVKALLKKGAVLEMVGKWDECQDVYTEALMLSNQTDDPLLLGRANNALGYLLMMKGEYDTADSYLKKATDFFRAVNDARGIAKSFGNQGNLYFRQGDYEKAKLFFIKSLDLIHDLPYKSINAQIVSNLGLTYMNQGNYDEGIKTFLNELKYIEEANDKQAIATLNTNLGIVYFEKGDYDEALACYTKGLKLSEELGNRQLTAIAIGCIGSVYQNKGDYEKALDHYLRDLALCEDIGDKQGTAIAIGLIGELRSLQGEFDVAEKYLQHNLEICEDLSYKKGIAKSLNTLGDISTYQHKYDQAIVYYDRAIEISREIDNRLVLGYSLVEKTTVLVMKEDFEGALQQYKEALKIAKDLGNPDLLFDAKVLSASLTEHKEGKEKAIERLKRLLENAQNIREKAIIHYELFQMMPEEKWHKEKALELFKQLYRNEPQHIYQTRINQLTT